MRSWLYPVSGARGRGFRDAKGKRRRTTFEEIRDCVRAGRFPATTAWRCTQNGKNVEAGDELLVYTGECGVGIFAAGRVSSAEPAARGRGWILTWTLDERRTRALLERPVPAPRVRAHVHPRVTVRDFTAGARALRRSLGSPGR